MPCELHGFNNCAPRSSPNFRKVSRSGPCRPVSIFALTFLKGIPGSTTLLTLPPLELLSAKSNTTSAGQEGLHQLFLFGQNYSGE
jgi:hypothetical protein